MKLSLTIQDTIHTCDSQGDDLYHIILHFKSLLLAQGYDEEKIDGCLKGVVGVCISKE
ncbi:MAG: hypothetical protein GWP32_05895 [Bacteroidetes bacterium]|jgi:hypothetical protein|nr:hypothetical protein [Bacteroidota bacterium]